jgi:hypothetical protein
MRPRYLLKPVQMQEVLESVGSTPAKKRAEHGSLEP